MKKMLLILLLPLFLFACRANETTTMSPSYLTMLEDMKDQYDDKIALLLLDYHPLTLDNDVIIDSGEETIDQPEIILRDDYMEEYLNVYAFDYMSAVLAATLRDMNIVKEILDDEYFFSQVCTMLNVSDLPTYGEVSYVFKSFSSEGFVVEITSTYFHNQYHVSFNDDGTLVFISVAYDLTTGMISSYFDFHENTYYQELMMKEDQKFSYRFFNFENKDYLIYQNEDGVSYNYFASNLHALYSHDLLSSSMTYYNDHGPYLTFAEDSNRYIITWEMLEVSGWDYAIVDTSTTLQTVEAIYVGNTNIMDSSSNAFSNIDGFRHEASLQLTKTFDKEEMTDDILSMTDRGLTLNDSNICLIQIYVGMLTMRLYYNQYLLLFDQDLSSIDDFSSLFDQIETIFENQIEIFAG